MGSVEKGLGFLIESFSDFLQGLFEGNGNNELGKKELDKILISQGNLSIEEAIEKPFSELLTKFKNIDTEILDQLVVHLYDQTLQDNSFSRERLENTIMQLIKYLEHERSEFSLDRNNIKNSLQHNK